MGTYASRNPRAAASPLRSCQWGKPAYLVMHRPSMASAHEYEIRLARLELEGWGKTYAAACAQLGKADRFPAASHRFVWSGRGDAQAERRAQGHPRHPAPHRRRRDRARRLRHCAGVAPLPPPAPGGTGHQGQHDRGGNARCLGLPTREVRPHASRLTPSNPRRQRRPARGGRCHRRRGHHARQHPPAVHRRGLWWGPASRRGADRALRGTPARIGSRSRIGLRRGEPSPRGGLGRLLRHLRRNHCQIASNSAPHFASNVDPSSRTARSLLRWSRPSGRPGGLDKLGSGFCQAADLFISLVSYASSGVRPARAEWGRRAL